MDAVRRKAIHAAMVRLSDGDRSAFDVLLDELWPVLLSFAKRGVGATADAEDIAQEVFLKICSEVFLKICSRIADFDRSRDGLSWAFGIGSFEILTHRKRARRRREVHDETALEREAHDEASHDLVLEQREVAVAFERAVGGLTEDERALLGLVPQGAASGPASPALRKRKQRALERLRNIWKGIYGEP
jgi:RNA polymerase sigma-70 factor, ECF subfamily